MEAFRHLGAEAVDPFADRLAAAHPGQVAAAAGDSIAGWPWRRASFSAAAMSTTASQGTATAVFRSRVAARCP